MNNVHQYLEEMADYFISTGILAPNQRGVALSLPSEYAAYSFEDRALVLAKGCEIHLYVRDSWRKRAVSRRAAHAVLAPILERYGYVTTVMLLNEDASKIDFIRRLGFAPTWSDGERQFYMLTKLPFSRSK